MRWQLKANCRGLDPGLFFPERGDPAAEAKAVCAGCEVKEPCLREGLEGSVSFGEGHSEKLSGIWAGTNGSERRRLRASRSRRSRRSPSREDRSA